jgi:hypothetical protein
MLLVGARVLCGGKTILHTVGTSHAISKMRTVRISVGIECDWFQGEVAQVPRYDSNNVSNLIENIDSAKKSTETSTDASKEVDLEVNPERTKYTLLPRHQNARQNHDVKIAKRSFQSVAQFKYSGTTVAIQNLFQK